MGVTLALVECDRLGEQTGGRLGLGGVGGERAGPVEQGGFPERLVGQPGGLLAPAITAIGASWSGSRVQLVTSETESRPPPGTRSL